MSIRKQISMVGILLISTRKYKQFVWNLILQINESFVPVKDRHIFLFTDKYQRYLPSNVTQIMIPSYGFPEATLFRFSIFHKWKNFLKKYTHLFYLDIDSFIAEPVGNEFLTEGLLAVRHPGFYKQNGWGDSINPKESNSYLPPEKRKHYYCGGVQGGETGAYLTACKVLSEGIEEDEKNGIIAEHNDETFWNFYIHTSGVKTTEFSPSYCMVEELSRRVEWGIDDLEVKIIALTKDHKSIRE